MRSGPNGAAETMNPEGAAAVPKPPQDGSPGIGRLPISTAVRACVASRFFRFLVVGGLNTAFSYALFAVLILLGVHYAAAGLVTTVSSVAFNFNTTGRLVFGSHDGSRIFRFTVVYAIMYVVGTGLVGIAKEVGVPVLLSSAVLLLPMALLGFTLQRLLVFRAKRSGAAAERGTR